jgi:cathepsin L
MVLLALLCFILASAWVSADKNIPCDTTTQDSDIDSIGFNEWKSNNGRKYQGGKEEKNRGGHWKRRNCEIDYLNKLGRTSGGAQFDHNQYSDWSADEFTSLLGSKRRPETPTDPETTKRALEATLAYNAPLPAPSSADWCAKGYCSPVKNQQNCGSCWAYSSTAAYESAYAIAYNTPNNVPVFSPQYLLDCNSATSTVRPCTASNCYKSNGCDGGYIAFDYITNRGHFRLTDYPIASDYMQKTCSKASSVQQTEGLTSWYEPPYNSPATEDQIAANVAKYGPAVVLIYADNWQSYSGGIMTASQCGTGDVNHAVVITGYDNAGGYWIIRNSWGSSWGEKGFIRMQKGVGACQIQGYEGLDPAYIVGPSKPPATPPATPTAPVKPPATPTAPVKPPATPTAPVKPPATPTAPVKPPATPTAPVKPPATPTAPVKPPATPTNPPGASCKYSSCMDWPQKVGAYTLNQCSNIPSYGVPVSTYGICISSVSGSNFQYYNCPSSCGSKPPCYGSGCPVSSEQQTITAINAETSATFTPTGSNLSVYIGAAVVGVVCLIVILVIIVVVKRRANDAEIV